MFSPRTSLVVSLCVLAGCGPAEGQDRAPGRATRSPAAAAATTGSAPAAAIDRPQAAGDWPRWRGPNLDGISAERDWSSDWPADGPPQVWQSSVGTGFSSIAIAGGRLYTMGHVGGKEGDDVVWCLDAASGNELWKHSYRCKLVANLHEGGPACTPTVDRERVFTVSKEGHLFCLDAAEGSVVWQKRLTDELGVKVPEWGFSCSPLIVGERVIVEAGRTAAFHRETGELLWKTDKYRPGYGSAVDFGEPRAGAAGGRWIAVLNNDFLMVVDARDGAELAREKWETSFATNSITPIVVGRRIFISTGYHHGCSLWSFDGKQLQLVYENKNMRNHMNNCVLWKGHLYGFDGNSHNRRNVTLACIDFETGELQWKERGLGCGSLMLAGGRLIVLGDRGELVIVDPSPEKMREIARAKILDGKCWTVPVLSRGKLYARNATGDLVCVDMGSS